MLCFSGKFGYFRRFRLQAGRTTGLCVEDDAKLRNPDPLDGMEGNMNRFTRTAAAVAVTSTLLLAGLADAKSVTLGRTETNTDYKSFGLGGIGTGSGEIVVEGVDGPVRKAFLYWHGIDRTSQGGNGIYDNQTISFAGSDVTGISLGDASTNCWGTGGSRGFFADVSSLVDGNGTYVVGGLDAQTGHNGNGFSLIVLYDDGDNTNNRDLVFFEGNDSDIFDSGHPDDPAGWQAVLNNINYTGGVVLAQMHIADGQDSGDGPITFTGVSPVTIADTPLLWDGISVPSAGRSRTDAGDMWDIHTFDISGAFGEPGSYNINLNGMNSTGDCHALVVLMIDLNAGSAPCGDGVVGEGEECDPNAGTNACDADESCLNDCTCGCVNDFQCNDGIACSVDSCDVETGACEYDLTACADQCPGECGDPVSPFGTVTARDASFILRTSVELEECLPCVCDVDSSGEVLASDALLDLQFAVRLPVALNCPAYVPPTTTTTLDVVTTTTIEDVVTTTTIEDVVTTTTIEDVVTTTTIEDIVTTTTLPDIVTTTTLEDVVTTTTIEDVVTTTTLEDVVTTTTLEDVVTTTTLEDVVVTTTLLPLELN
jgi:hypothetical protein